MIKRLMCAKNFTNMWDLKMYRIKLRIKILSNIQEKTEDKETYVRRVWEVKQQMLAAMPKVSSYKYKYHTSANTNTYTITNTIPKRYKYKLMCKYKYHTKILQCANCVTLHSSVCIHHCGVKVSLKLPVHTDAVFCCDLPMKIPHKYISRCKYNTGADAGVP